MTARWFETFLMVAALAFLIRMGLTAVRAARDINHPAVPPPSGSPDLHRMSPAPGDPGGHGRSGPSPRDRHLVRGGHAEGAEVRPGPSPRRSTPRASAPTTYMPESWL